MKVHIIGRGCPDPNPRAFGSAFVLELGDDAARERILIDCGPAATYKMAQIGIRPLEIEHLFFTHHHFDHNLDFPTFALCRWDQSIGKETTLKVYGPPPTKRFIDALFADKTGAFAEDLEARVQHPASWMCHEWRGGTLPRPKPAHDVIETTGGVVAESANWKCTAAQVHHCEPWLMSLAYRFETSEGSIVFAADCGDCPEIRAFSKDADNIVMACTHFGPNGKNDAVIDVITGSPCVAEIGKEANIKRVILTHTSPNYNKAGVKERTIADIVTRGYEGEIIFPDELDTVPL